MELNKSNSFMFNDSIYCKEYLYTNRCEHLQVLSWNDKIAKCKVFLNKLEYKDGWIKCQECKNQYSKNIDSSQ